MLHCRFEQRNQLLLVAGEALSDKRRPQFDRQRREIDRFEKIYVTRFVLRTRIGGRTILPFR